MRGSEGIVVNLVGRFEEVMEQSVFAKIVQYMNNERLCQLIFALYRDKVKTCVILITITVLWHLASEFVLDFLALPFAVCDTVKVSSWVVFGKKVLSSALFTSPIVIIGIWGLANFIIILSAIGLITGYSGMVLTKGAGLMIIETQDISGLISLIIRRVGD